MRDARGRLLRSVEVGARMDRHGEARTLERTDVVDLLCSHGGGAPVRMGTTVRQVEQDDEAARVVFGDGSELFSPSSTASWRLLLALSWTFQTVSWRGSEKSDPPV
jgi:2-polyprenyl-6-methoxyphenol hydroxylase-like FAD-dependent oxidoreductase